MHKRELTLGLPVLSLVEGLLLLLTAEGRLRA